MSRAHPYQALAINDGEEFEAVVAKDFEDMLDAVGSTDGLAMANK